MSNKQFLADQVKGGLVKIDYTGAVNNKYYMPMPMSTPKPGHGPLGLSFVCEEPLPPHATSSDKEHDPVTVRVELRQPKRRARKQKKSILL